MGVAVVTPSADDWVLQSFNSAQVMIKASDAGWQLEGHDEEWLPWVTRNFPHVVTKPFGPRHHRLWQWVESLRLGQEPPPPFVALWPRGSAKSTTLRLGAVRTAITLNRRFLLYVSGTQDQCNKHIQSIAEFMERVGLERSLNQYNISRGWRADMLRTANGFNVLGVGLDVAVRGLNLGHFRPDWIEFDDIDDKDDTLATLEKKRETITQDILFAGSQDCAVSFTQNLVWPGSIASQIAKREADFLIGAIIDGPYAAFDGFSYAKHPDAVAESTGEIIEGKYYIVSGVPTWEGYSKETAEADINKMGPMAFLREMQNDFRASGAFFPEYDEKAHLIHEPPYSPESPPPAWWNYFGGLDDGYNDPCAFGLMCHDDLNRVHVLESWEARFLRPAERAQKVLETLMRWGIDPAKCPITYDHTMNASTWKGVRSEPDVKAFTDVGLFMRASDPMMDRSVHGWNKIRQILSKRTESGSGHLLIYKTHAKKYADALSVARFHATKPEDLAHDGASHLNHMGLYGICGQFGMAIPPESEEVKQKKAKGRMLGLVGFRREDIGGKVKGRDYV